MMEEPQPELLNKLFEKKKFKPNKPQLEAITTIDGPLFLTAGPGSGKTRVLLWRVVNLIVNHNIKPDEIFLATFTEKAALQLKEGLQGLLSLASELTGQPYDIAEMYVGTLHSLCQKLLVDRRFMRDRARCRKPILLDDLGQHFFVSNHWKAIVEASDYDFEDDNYSVLHKEINEWFGTHQGKFSKTLTVKNCISFFNRMSEEDFSDEDLKCSNVEDIEKTLLKMAKKYRELLREGKTEIVDFSSLQQKAYNHICQLEEAKSVFKYVIVDEYQDTNTIQQKIYLHLASGNKNICVVGDDDQALYRFRGATVENLVNFETICQEAIGIAPKRIDLNINYRSRKQIVDAYTSFIDKSDWSNPDNNTQYYRIQNKNIVANSIDEEPAVIFEKGKKEIIAPRIAHLVKELKEQGKISDYNQCAVLFHSLTVVAEKEFEKAFEAEGIPFYAPRANNILYSTEFMVVLGIFATILNMKARPGENQGQMKDFHTWLQLSLEAAEEVISSDTNLSNYIAEKSIEIAEAKDNYQRLFNCCQAVDLSLKTTADGTTTQFLAKCPGISDGVKKLLTGTYLNRYIQDKLATNTPVTVGYILSRVTSLDWTLLDLFYQLNVFNWFKEKYDSVEQGGEDSALYNFGLLTGYLSRYMDQYGAIITGRSFMDNYLNKLFFNNYLFTLLSLGQPEYEDADDPFPKGCVPFLTIHQSKGLEFPIVILGSCQHSKKAARPLDVFVHKMLDEKCRLPMICEPLERMDEYDTMRMFYVALSRAQNLLVLADSHATFSALSQLQEEMNFCDTDSFDISVVPKYTGTPDRLTHVYTYTGDYLPYNQCPRKYMAFNKYNFVPSRSQTMFFGSLVHQSIEDLQNYINGVTR